MPPVVIGGAIAAAGAIGGSVLGASATKSAANSAAASAERTAAANNALARETYAKNENALSPFMERGNSAGDAINALLGLDVPARSGTVDWGKYISSQPDVAYDRTLHGDMSTDQYGQWHYAQDGSRRDLTPYTSGGTTGTTAGSAADAFANYRNSDGYRFRYDQGMNALNTGYAARGLLNSGAAQKAALKFGQDYGSNEFGNYLGYLSNQQGVGLSGASALAGVGQNYVGTVSANNNAAGTAAANAALIGGTATGNMYSGIANALGKFGSSFGSGTGFTTAISPSALSYLDAQSRGITAGYGY